MKMGKCRVECVVDSKHDKYCLECEEYESCTVVCDNLDRYEYAEECSYYEKEDGDGNEK